MRVQWVPGRFSPSPSRPGYEARWITVDDSLRQVQPASKYMFHFNNWGPRSGMATSYASARARSDMHIIMHLVWAWIKQPLICMMVTNGNVQAIVHRRLQRIIDIIASTLKSEDGEVFVPSFKLLCNRYKP